MIDILTKKWCFPENPNQNLEPDVPGHGNVLWPGHERCCHGHRESDHNDHGSLHRSDPPDRDPRRFRNDHGDDQAPKVGSDDQTI
jgi:hypothetical protein